MRTTLILVWAMVSGFRACNAATISDADILLLIKYQHGGARAPKALELGLASRSDAIQFVREQKELIRIGDYALYPYEKMKLLANLGDIEALNYAYRNYLARDVESIERSPILTPNGIFHPALIAIVSEGLAIEPHPTIGSFHRPPYGIAAAILKIVARSGYFPTDTASWAADLEARGNIYKSGQLFFGDACAFWELNREHLIAGRYDQVRPPPSAPNAVATPAKVAAPPAVVAPPPPMPAPEKTPPRESATGEPVTESAKGLGPWPWLLAAIALLFTLSVVFTKKK